MQPLEGRPKPKDVVSSAAVPVTSSHLPCVSPEGAAALLSCLTSDHPCCQPQLPAIPHLSCSESLPYFRGKVGRGNLSSSRHCPASEAQEEFSFLELNSVT